MRKSLRRPVAIASAVSASMLAAAMLVAATAGPLGSGPFHVAQATETADRKTDNPPAPAPPITGTPAAVIDDREVEGILGKNIRASSGETMGRIVDVIVSRSGHVRGVVIDFGGFLGVGSRKIAVDWGALHFAIGDKPASITVDLTRDQLRLAPEYKSGEPVVLLGATVPVVGQGAARAPGQTPGPSSPTTAPPSPAPPQAPSEAKPSGANPSDANPAETK